MTSHDFFMTSHDLFMTSHGLLSQGWSCPEVLGLFRLPQLSRSLVEGKLTSQDLCAGSSQGTCDTSPHSQTGSGLSSDPQFLLPWAAQGPRRFFPVDWTKVRQVLMSVVTTARRTRAALLFRASAAHPSHNHATWLLLQRSTPRNLGHPVEAPDRG